MQTEIESSVTTSQKKKSGRPKGSKDKVKRRAKRAIPSYLSKSENTKPEGCFRIYRHHPPKPYFTTKPTVEDSPDTWFLKPHQVKKFDEICPQGLYKDEIHEQNPFRVTFK